MESVGTSLTSRVVRVWCKVKQSITIEPVIILFLFSIVSSTGTAFFHYEKACATKLGLDLQICEHFVTLEDNDICNKNGTVQNITENITESITENIAENFTENFAENITEFEIQVCEALNNSALALAKFNKYRSIAEGIVQAAVLLFVGSWSDRVGLRKPCILVPIAADIVSYGIYILGAVYMREIPLEVTGILPGLIGAFSGGPSLVVTGIYSYLTICTDEKDRTFRFAYSGVLITLIPIAATVLSGPLFKYLGLIKLCILCIVTNSLALLYGLFVLKEPANAGPTVDDQTNNQGNAISSKHTVRQLFDISLVKDCVKAFLKKRDFNCRNILYLALLANLINHGTLEDYDYAKLLATSLFKWITKLGVWRSYELLSTTLGTLLAIGVLSKRFGVSDAMICVFSVCFSLVGKPIMAVAVSTVTPYLYFVATSIDVFEGSKMVAVRSLVSKLVGQDEIAKVLSILGIVDSLQISIYPTIYSTVFLETLSFFVGTVFLLSEALLLVSLGIYIALYLMSRRSERDKNRAESTAKQGIDNPAVDTTAL